MEILLAYHAVRCLAYRTIKPWIESSFFWSLEDIRTVGSGAAAKGSLAVGKPAFVIVVQVLLHVSLFDTFLAIREWTVKYWDL